MRTLITCTFLLFACFFHLSGQTVYRAGDISVRLVGDVLSSMTVQATIKTYTKDALDHGDVIEICWGDGICEELTRINGPGNPPQGELLEDNFKMNIYEGFHTFPAISNYTISATDCCWSDESLNILNPESTEFRLFSEYTFTNPLYQGANAQPIFLQPGFDLGVIGQSFNHNPNAYDSDGDSLVYDFFNLSSDNYVLPDQIMPGPDNLISIESDLGDILWDSPQQAGKYHLFVTITEYRDGIPIGKNLRVMEIDIRNEVVATEETAFQDWKICPNPATDILNLELDRKTNLSASIQLINTMGQLVLEKKITNSLSTLSLPPLPTGMYFLKIRQGKRTQISPLVIR